jgi:hypothetical protein
MKFTKGLNNMKWIAISGSWRKTNLQVEKDVRRTVRGIILNGDGIITGGALNVDCFAITEVIKTNPKLNLLKIYLPTSLKIFENHYLQSVKQNIITLDQATELISLLEKVKSINPNALIENPLNPEVNQASYYFRNQLIIDASDELNAFQVNQSQGTQDTIDKAKRKGIPVKLYTYTIV